MLGGKKSKRKTKIVKKYIRKKSKNNNSRKKSKLKKTKKKQSYRKSHKKIQKKSKIKGGKGPLCNEPDNVLKPKLYCSIKKKIRKRIDAKGQRWGAYTSGQLVQEYKRQGGTYSGKKKQDSNLGRWYKEKWVDVCHWPKRKSCGRKKFSAKKFPYCRPSIRVNSKTPKTAGELTAKQRKTLCAKKRLNPKKVMKKA